MQYQLNTKINHLVVLVTSALHFFLFLFSGWGSSKVEVGGGPLHPCGLSGNNQPAIVWKQRIQMLCIGFRTRSLPTLFVNRNGKGPGMDLIIGTVKYLDDDKEEQSRPALDGQLVVAKIPVDSTCKGKVVS